MLPEAITENNNCSKVFCDIETDFIHKDTDMYILKISAVFEDKIYDQYITQTRSIAQAASAVACLTA